MLPFITPEKLFFVLKEYKKGNIGKNWFNNKKIRPEFFYSILHVLKL